jgi:hypothetical protein
VPYEERSGSTRIVSPATRPLGRWPLRPAISWPNVRRVCSVVVRLAGEGALSGSIRSGVVESVEEPVVVGAIRVNRGEPWVSGGGPSLHGCERRDPAGGLSRIATP